MQERGEFRVSVTKDYLVFSSAHFITFAGHRCEGLHGHNYRANVTVEGALNKETWFVFDFVELKHIMKRLCDEIDHLVLLPLESERVGVVESGDTVAVSVDGKPRYVFPRKDCALLPIPNTTVEMLAQLLTERLLRVHAAVVSPTHDTLAVGETAQLVATAHSLSRAPMSGRKFVWWSNDVSIASVTQAGLVTALAVGEATIGAITGTTSGTARIVVLARP